MKRVNSVGETAVSITGCILSYPHLFAAKQVNGRGEPKFSANFIFPADMDQGDWDLLNGIVVKVTAARWGANQPPNIKLPWKDAGVADPAFAGRIMVGSSAKAESPPKVVLEDARTLAEPGTVYPGMGVNAYLNVFAYDASGNKGVSFGLNAVQIADRTLKRLDGRKDASEVFSPMAAPAGAPPPVSPTPHAPTPAFAGAMPPGPPQAPSAPVPGPGGWNS